MIVEEVLSDNKNIKNVYENYNRKIILKAIDLNKKYSFFRLTKLWGFIFTVTLPFGVLYQIRDQLGGYYNPLICNTIFIIGIVLGFCFSYTKIYFSFDKMIVRNLLKKEIEIDLSKYPRIFTTYIEYKGYDKDTMYSYKAYYLYFQQNERKIKIRLYLNSIKKISRLLENFEIVSLEQLPQDKQLISANEKEIIMTNYIKRHQGKRIIGIKDRSKKIILRKENPVILLVLGISFFVVLGMEYYFNIEMQKLGGEIGGVLVIELMILLTILIIIIYEYTSKFIKISYPTDELIKINGKKFNYIENNVVINIYRDCSRDSSIDAIKPFDEYIFQVNDNIGKSLKTKLQKSSPRTLKEFFENIEFEE